MPADDLEQGRHAFARQAWEDAFARLRAADDRDPLGAEDLERLATAAYLTGREEDGAEIGARAHQEFLARGDVERAVRCAFWVGFGYLDRGEEARGGGWLARARRLLDELGRDSVEQGYLLVPDAIQALVEGDAATGGTGFAEVLRIGERFADPDLLALGRLGLGGVRLLQRDTVAGVALLDEAMAGVEAGEVSPTVAGIVYCAVIEACQEIYDLGRARQWTAGLTRWCAAQPGLVPFQGQCLVHRAEIMALRGAWQDAMEEAARAAERLSAPPGKPATGLACYQQGELHRLRGEFTAAEEAYRQASQWGRDPQPGLALLRLAQGQVDAAASAVRRVLDESPDHVRVRLLPAQVEIQLAAGDVAAASSACAELDRLADELGAPFLAALAGQARGAVLLAEGDPRGALTTLRGAWLAWQDLDVPYEAGRVRALIGLACRELGDEDGARMELDAARWMFRQLSALPDLARVESLAGVAAGAGGLTARELEVLRLVVGGSTNRAIAADLVISERTVDRHVSNILTKLGVTSRAAATAHAFRHALL